MIPTEVADVSRLMSRTTGPATELVVPRLLHEVFERQAALRPWATALAMGEERLTYADLDQQSNLLARWLARRGIAPGDRVAILLPRSMNRYIALLAVLKVGAAYVPLDPDYPADRILFILDDCKAAALITLAEMADQLTGLGRAGDERTGDERAGYDGVVLALDVDAAAIALGTLDGPKTVDLAGRETLGPEDLCYIIYTSGTTGRPKGVAIEHHSACHFVAAEQSIFQIQATDRVYQGFSLAFDASVEEIWLAFAAGATLVVGDDDMAHAGPELANMLTAAGVTVFSCVPTLLAMLEDELPTVRLLILGGEACPQTLVSRWWRPGRRMVNTYGPTEATVVATFADCELDRPVTIGRPLPGYFVTLLDEQLRPVAPGEVGELHIGGAGLARGYVNRPELTLEKFILAPILPGSSPTLNGKGNGVVDVLGAATTERLYKSGDLGRLTADGEIEFLGRVDSQVKIRGFRVELAEIESALLQCAGVLAAAVTVHEASPGVQQLVAYIVPRGGGAESLDETSLRANLADRLPRFMIPAIFEPIDGLPTLPSGKVDRRQLPTPRTLGDDGAAQQSPARTPLEERIWQAWRTAFAPRRVELDDDFFLDLGGHSLLAARMVSQLRKDASTQTLSMLDVYKYPTIAQLAAHLADVAIAGSSKSSSEANGTGAIAAHGTASDSTKFRPVSRWTHFCCGAAQAAGLYVSLGLASLQWLAPYLAYTFMIEDRFSKLAAVGGACAGLLAIYPAMLCVVVASKWIVIGRYKAGSYPLWGLYYFRWWLAGAIQGVVPTTYLAGTPLLAIYYRLMGAKIGRNVYLGTDSCGSFDLMEIGDDASIGIDASLAGYTVADGMLHVGPITIGQRAFVGTRSVVCPGARIEDDAQLEDLSLLSAGACIPRGERWSGSPSRPTRDASTPGPGAAARRPSGLRRFGYGLLYAAGVFLFPLLALSAFLPGVMYLNHLDYRVSYAQYLLVAPPVALSFVVLLCLEIAAVKWLLLGRVRPGTYPIAGGFYFRKWFVDQLLELSLDVVGPLYATIYLAPWYRLLGARLGRRAEISTASFISPDLLTIEEEGFIADAVSLGAARAQNGAITIAPTRIGKRAFIGNSALLPSGATIADGALIGCLSTPPAAPQVVGPNTTWLGSPSFYLPSRQTSASFADEHTFKPSRKLWTQRALIEFVRITLPASIFLLITSSLLNVLVMLRASSPLPVLLAFFPLVYAACGIAATLFVVLAKWSLMGRYAPGERPLWSSFVWRTELVTALHENLADLFLTGSLEGTPFLPWFFRLLGAKMGRRVWMETTALTEFDLITIGDDVALNHDSTIQTHLFEDRVMKMSTITIGDRASVGALSLVLYDTVMEPGSRLGDLSLLMKGETLPAESRWEGSPARAHSTATSL